ncbi:MAG: hypothetical protein V1798_02420 [Pseudomonadota bacterium]
MIPLLVVLLCLLVPSFSEAQERPPRFKIENSLQAGPEYDSNIFRTYTTPTKDTLARLLFGSHATVALSDAWFTGWNFQLGGKLFFRHTEKNRLIQYIAVPFTWAPNERFSVTLSSDFKYQRESSALDNPDPALASDINEDFYSPSGQIQMRWGLPAGVSLEPFGLFTYYRFRTIPTYSYYLEKGGVLVRKTLFPFLAIGAQYAYFGTQFLDTTRADREHEISGLVQYLGLPYITARYIYEDSTSNDPSFSFKNHRVTVTVSLPFGERKEEPLSASFEGVPSTLFAVHLIGAFQFRKYPSVVVETQEGRRYLLTGAEDDNFNQILVKFTIHPTKRWAFETKYTLYSSGASDQPVSYHRSLAYAGARLTF